MSCIRPCFSTFNTVEKKFPAVFFSTSEIIILLYILNKLSDMILWEYFTFSYWQCWILNFTKKRWQSLVLPCSTGLYRSFRTIANVYHSSAGYCCVSKTASRMIEISNFVKWRFSVLTILCAYEYKYLPLLLQRPGFVYWWTSQRGQSIDWNACHVSPLSRSSFQDKVRVFCVKKINFALFAMNPCVWLLALL